MERARMAIGKVLSDIGSQIHVNYLDGDDRLGNGTPLAPYKTITKAFAMVTSTRKYVMLAPGEYTEAASLSWPDVTGVVLMGSAQWTTIITGAASADQVISVAPTISGTFEMYILDIYLDHDTSGQDGLLITNAATNGKILCYLRNFGADGDSADKSIITDHTLLDTEAIRIYLDGNNGGIAGDIYFDVENNGDRLYLTGCELPGGVETSADAIAGTLRFINCWGLPENAALTGGNAAQTILSQNSYSDAPAVINTTDLAGSHTETIIGS